MIPKLATNAIAGWLFADLLLAFSIVVLGTQEPPPVPAPAASAEPTPSPTPTPAPTRQALQRRFVTVDLAVDANDAQRGGRASIAALKKALSRHPVLRGRTAGIVLTFGAEHSGGEKFAHAVNNLLARADSSLFRNVRTRDFQLIGASNGQLELQIYLFYDE
ncbi:hypothetical protein J5X84_07445 [Streptosporangiaceae bacterium NEAU-GS5]|nr:hypothetical protein [Streptosporangiaceae bacterium NEAU-GS5]